MRNIAIIISDITKSAGTERAVTNLANCLCNDKKNRISIISIYTSNDDKPYYRLREEVEVIHLQMAFENNIIHRIIAYHDIRKKLKRIIEQDGVTVLIGTTHAYNIIISTIENAKTIGCEHMNYDACPKVARLIRKIAYKRLDSLVVLTNEDAKHYSFINSSKLQVIPNISSFERKEKSDTSAHRIITAGRFSMQKGYDILVEIINDIKDKLNGWVIDIYGTGEMESKLREAIRRYALGDTIVIHPPTQGIKDEMLQSGFYLMTSRHEGLPMVLIEAQTCGLPIISFNCPEGPSEIITDGYDGYLVPMNDYALMKKRIVELINDDDKRKIFGDNAYQNSIKYSKGAISNKWDQLFSAVEES